jgi:hypothetical protein
MRTHDSSRNGARDGTEATQDQEQPQDERAVTALQSLLQNRVSRITTTYSKFRAHNSAVECILHTDEVVGSIPTAPTKVTGNWLCFGPRPS